MARTIILDGKRVSFCGKRNEEQIEQPDIFTVVKKEIKIGEYGRANKYEKKTAKVDIETKNGSFPFDNIEIKGEIE